jgi:peptidoglycan/xylan/chitin deacetylase (PgdA/CDA1 family)
MRDVCFTIDVEDFFLPRPPHDTIFARVGGEQWGIRRMMDLLSAHGACGTFYVDVFNRTTLTEDLLATACREIMDCGHELGLHTHPEFPSGTRGYGMQQVMARHSLREQRGFIEDGVAMIEHWTGARPRTHRAGGYGADRNTLRALKAAGLQTDSSLYPGYAGCPLGSEFAAINSCFSVEGILEVPITVTHNRFGAALPGGRWLGPQLNMKIDIDWLDLPGLQTQIDAALERSSAPLVIFMHSYSFLDLGRKFKPVPAQADKLRRLLQWLSARHDIAMPSITTAASRAQSGDASIRNLPTCDFHLLSEPLRWARFATSAISVERVGKFLRASGTKT